MAILSIFLIALVASGAVAGVACLPWLILLKIRKVTLDNWEKVLVFVPFPAYLLLAIVAMTISVDLLGRELLGVPVAVVFVSPVGSFYFLVRGILGNSTERRISQRISIVPVVIAFVAVTVFLGLLFSGRISSSMMSG